MAKQMAYWSEIEKSIGRLWFFGALCVFSTHTLPRARLRARLLGCNEESRTYLYDVKKLVDEILRCNTLT